MISWYWLVAGCILAIIHWFAETFLQESKKTKATVKTLSLLIVLTTFGSVFSTYEDLSASEMKEQKQKVEIAELRQQNAESKNKILEQQNQVLRMEKGLNAERSKIRTLSGNYVLRIRKNWLEGIKPYSWSLSIFAQYYETVVLETWYPHLPNGFLVKLYPTKFIAINERDEYTEITADFAVKGDSEILGMDKNAILKLHDMRLRVYIANRGNFQPGIHLESFKIRLKVNESDVYEIKKELDFIAPPKTGIAWQDTEMFYLPLYFQLFPGDITRVKQ